MNIKKMNDLSEKVVFLTGAAGLLGYQYATTLSDAGANVIIADINYSKCKKIEKELEEKKDVTPFALKMDISQPTLSRILKSGRKKIADAIVNGKAIKIKE